jgi:hypothetical protein
MGYRKVVNCSVETTMEGMSSLKQLPKISLFSPIWQSKKSEAGRNVQGATKIILREISGSEKACSFIFHPFGCSAFWLYKHF